ncbi:MAG: type II toxin-antitoxin system VapC family toxin [Clostridiales bacterium]|nr:type II toxin-antitoxin system VapC family toxin [Clostridiales bacterium]
MAQNLQDIPESGDIFIDTNVLVYLHGRPLPPEAKKYNKQVAYSAAIGSLLRNKRTLVTTWLGVMEVLHVHERHMFEEYKSLSTQHSLSRKDYRRNLEERARVQAELKRILREIKAYYLIIPTDPAETPIDQFVNTYTNHTYDPNDFIMIESATNCGVKDAITDDSDFHSDTRLTVYTY